MPDSYSPYGFLIVAIMMAALYAAHRWHYGFWPWDDEGRAEGERRRDARDDREPTSTPSPLSSQVNDEQEPS